MSNKRIADCLTALADNLPESPIVRGPQLVYRDGGFVIRCELSRPAVLAVAAKYRRGVRRRRATGDLTMYRITHRPSGRLATRGATAAKAMAKFREYREAILKAVAELR